MNFDTNSNLPTLQPRHFAPPETLTPQELEANFIDATKLQQEKMKTRKSLRRPRKGKSPFPFLAQGKSHEDFHNFIKDVPYDKATVAYFANKGSKTAKRLFATLQHFDKAWDLIVRIADKRDIVTEMAAGLRFTEFEGNKWDTFTIKIADALIIGTFERYCNDEKSQLDMDGRICFISNTSDPNVRIALLKEAIKKYPDEITFRIFLCDALQFVNEHKKGIEVADEALKKFPNNSELLGYKAVHLGMSERFEEMVDTYMKFLEVAPIDHEDLPEVYYVVAMGLKNYKGAKFSEVEKYYKWGLEAEKERLPFFPPLESIKRERLEMMMVMFTPGEAIIKEQCKIKGNGFKQMNELLAYDRVVFIRGYRDEVRKIKQGKMECRDEPKLRKRKLLPLKEHKFVSLEKIFDKRGECPKLGLKCLVIEEAVVVGKQIRLLVEDDEGEFVRVFVKQGSQEFAGKFSFGRKISLLSPCVWVDENEDVEIWVAGEEFVVFGGGGENRCHFCWKIGAMKKCGKCKQCFYCSLECQEIDWKILKHNYTCKK